MVLSKFLYSLVLDMFESIAVVSSNTKTHNVSQNSSWNSDLADVVELLVRNSLG